MEEAVPPHTIIDFGFEDEGASLALMCRGVRFLIEIRQEDLRGTHATAEQSLEEQFEWFRDHVDDDPFLMEDFETWAVEPCTSLLRALAPAPTRAETCSLEAYFDPRTFSVHLHNDGGVLRARLGAEDAGFVQRLAPRVSPADLRLPRDQLDKVQRVKASQLYIDAEANPDDVEFCAVPRAVRSPASRSRLFFKAAVDGASFERELGAYLRCTYGDCGKKTRVPRLEALVEWSAGGALMGFTTEYIEHEGNLRDAVGGASRPTREKWCRQIEEAVADLHDLGLVSGDAKPENVLVDARGDARVIDFGGGYSPDWVDDELSETREGDLQALSKIKEFLGI